MDIGEKKILAFDTSWDFGVVGCLRGLDLIEKVYGRSPRAASEGLLPWIVEVTGRSGWKKGDIDVIAVGKGPGSFTGTRIAVATARALAEALHAAVVGVSSAESIALTMGKPGEYLAVLQDARKGEVLLAVYEVAVEEEQAPAPLARMPVLRPVDEPGLMSPGDALEKLAGRARTCRPLAVCGNAARTYPGLVRGLPPAAAVMEELRESRIDPVAIAALALRRLVREGKEDADELRPIYLRGM
jgi:tRNA threonylcarbamoyl adenosine modification protein YeaZ